MGGWVVVEALGAVVAAWSPRSLLLLAFGIDSGIELISTVVLLWRLRQEAFAQLNQSEGEKMERRAARIAGWLLYMLAIYVTLQAAYSLWERNAANTSFLGMGIAVVAALGMPFLAKTKLRVADQIESHALQSDAMETLTCGYLAWALLTGLVVNALTHWWWIDSVASLAIVPLLLREAKEAFSGSCHSE